MSKRESVIKKYERLFLNPITGWPTPKTKKVGDEMNVCSLPKNNNNGFSVNHN